jgi:hypothetical protein
MLGRVWPRHGHRGRPLNSVVRLHVKRRAFLTMFTILTLGVPMASATSCMGPSSEGLTQWVATMAQDADRIFLATVVSVSPKGRTPDSPGPSATIRIVKSLKGSGDLTSVDNSWLSAVRPIKNETRVFFTDKTGVILACSNYRDWLTNDGVMLELERVVKRRAT